MGDRVLITGGAGFIGKFVAEELFRRGKEPIIFDRFLEPDFPYPENVVLGDAKNKESLERALGDAVGIIHLAAVLGTQETINHSLQVVENNLISSINVFDLCRDRKLKGVYIAVGNHWMENPYSISKTAAEDFALFYNKEFSTKIAIVRGMNAFGESQRTWPVRKMVPNFIVPAIHDEPIYIYGSGEQIADLIYVKDLAKILVNALLDDHGVYDRAFEAGMGYSYTVNQIAGMISELTGSLSIIEHLPMRPGEHPESKVIANPQSLEPLMSPNEFTPLHESIRKTIDWYQKNSQGGSN
jgi:UDP-glucose 4-epimerase